MPTRYRAFEVKFDRGLNLDENPNALENGDLITADNVWYSGRRLGTRPGIRYEASGYSEEIAGNKPIQGGYEYRKDNDATRNMVTIAADVLPGSAGVIRTAYATVVTKGAGVVVSNGAENVWTFAQHKGVMYAAGGAADDTPWYWAGTGNATLLTIQDLTPAAISPHYIFGKWNRLFTCGFNITSSGAISTDLSSNPMIVRYSQLNEPTVWPAANTFGGTSAIGAFSSYGNEYLTGFGEYTDNDGDWLLVLSNRTIYEIQEAPDVYTPFYISRRGKAPMGCVHQRAFVSLGLDSGDAVYMSEHGIHSLRQSQQYGGREDKFLSWRIRPVFSTVNPSMRSRACGAYWREQGVVIFAVATGSNTVNDTLLVLDVKGQDKGLTADTARWTIWRLAGSSSAVYGVNALWEGRTADGEWVIYGGNNNGDVFYFDKDTFNDLDEAYPIRVATMHQDHGAPASNKVLGDTYVHVQPGGTYSPRIKAIFDYGSRQGPQFAVQMAPANGGVWDGSLWDDAAWDVVASAGRNKRYTQGHYNTISWQLEHATKDEPVYLTRLVHDAAGMGEDMSATESAA